MAENHQSKYTYYAFISYKLEDEKWAKWLHKRLESYREPTIPLASQKEIYIIEVPAWNVTDTVFMPCVEGQIIELEK